MRSPSDFGRESVCQSADTSVFFPSSGDPHGPAKAMCARCPVEDVCLAWALANPVHAQGVWGGTSESERRRIRKRRRKARSNAPREGGAAAS